MITDHGLGIIIYNSSVSWGIKKLRLKSKVVTEEPTFKVMSECSLYHKPTYLLIFSLSQKHYKASLQLKYAKREFMASEIFRDVC